MSGMSTKNGGDGIIVTLMKLIFLLMVVFLVLAAFVMMFFSWGLKSAVETAGQDLRSIGKVELARVEDPTKPTEPAQPEPPMVPISNQMPPSAPR